MTPLPACEDFPLPRRIAESAFAACVPIAATFEITRRCNLRCRHCFNTDRRIGGPGDPAEIPTEIAIRILEGLREAGGLHVAFTGGEPLIHPDLATLVGIARSLGFIPALLTNGTRLDRGAADALAEAGLEEIRISLHGASAAGHDRFTGEPGSFDAALRGIAAARAAGISVRLALLLTGASAGEAAGMLALAAGMNLPFRIDLAITPRHDGTRPPEDIPADRGTRAALFRGPLRHFLPTPDPTRPLRCACARSTCGIDATGELLPCLGAPIPAGNLRERPFADLWRNSPVLNRIRALTDTDFTACGACPLRAFCRRSPGAAYLATGNYTGPDPQACVEAGVLREILSPREIPDSRIPPMTSSPNPLPAEDPARPADSASAFWNRLLEKGHAVAIVYGQSMRPALRSGDIVLCWKIPAHAARTGDILAVPAGRRILFHRLIRRVRRESSGEWRLSLKGDAQAKTGNLSWPGHSLGRVEAAWRDGVTIPLRRGITAAVLSRFSGRLQEWMEDLARR